MVGAYYPRRRHPENGPGLHYKSLLPISVDQFPISFVPLAKGIAISSSVYDIPCSYIRGRAVVTNTAPTSAYRSAGRPEVVFVLERMIDIACRRYGFDRLEVRRPTSMRQFWDRALLPSLLRRELRPHRLI